MYVEISFVLKENELKKKSENVRRISLQKSLCAFRFEHGLHAEHSKIMKISMDFTAEKKIFTTSMAGS